MILIGAIRLVFFATPFMDCMLKRIRCAHGKYDMRNFLTGNKVLLGAALLLITTQVFPAKIEPNPLLIDLTIDDSQISTIESKEWDSSRLPINQVSKIAQFKLPDFGVIPNKKLPKMMTRLPYEYSYGSESEVNYHNNYDFNDSLSDEFFSITPELNFELTYRPTDWFETTWQASISDELVIKQTNPLTLPNGDVEFPEDQTLSLLIDQGYITISNIIDPLKMTIGRKLLEDQRHWLYDTSLDLVMLEWKEGFFTTALSYSRQEAFDGDLLISQENSRTNNFLIETRYRGIEDHTLSVFHLRQRNHAADKETPKFLGLQIAGNPNNHLSYWGEFATVRGRDEEGRNLKGCGADIGLTLKKGGKFNPNLTFGYAYGSGGDSNENMENRSFRQTGLHSNEAKFSGVSEFKTYGEVLDPDLSNIGIFTLGMGFYPQSNATLDVVYHQYRQNTPGSQLQDGNITATLDRDAGVTSHDLGKGLDIILGVRRAFGLRRLGFDLRLGWFFPGDAFRQSRGETQSDKSINFVMKVWW